MRLSIVVPAFNEEKLISQTLQEIQRALEPFHRRGWQAEVIVCDNNSSDRTAYLAGTADVKVVFEPINQISRARNKGAEAAAGDWLIFVDADSHPSPALMDDVAKQIESGTVLAGGSTVRMTNPSLAARAGIFLWNSVSRAFRLPAGSFIFCEAVAFREAGGFSSTLFAGEELELAAKLKGVARVQRKRLVILAGHPLLTSDRKLHLYSVGEHLWFFLKVALRWNSVLTDRDACHTWYDGRR